jgi:ATP-dependent Zn protease
MKRNPAITAYHESGHSVIARVLGVRVKRVSIVSCERYRGIVIHEKVILGNSPEYDDSPRTQRRIENKIRMAVAGNIAQKIYAPRSHNRSWVDYEEATAWALHINNGHDEAARAWIKWLELDVKRMLESRWEFVEAVANELLKAKTLNADQFEAIWQRVIADATKNYTPMVCLWSAPLLSEARSYPIAYVYRWSGNASLPSHLNLPLCSPRGDDLPRDLALEHSDVVPT